jgi:3-phenylpropionate/trans-cinnamate dioxygenase ferredoxin reductase component
MNVNVWDVTAPVDALITSGRQLDVARLADTDVALETL